MYFHRYLIISVSFYDIFILKQCVLNWMDYRQCARPEFCHMYLIAIAVPPCYKWCPVWEQLEWYQCIVVIFFLKQYVQNSLHRWHVDLWLSDYMILHLWWGLCPKMKLVWIMLVKIVYNVWLNFGKNKICISSEFKPCFHVILTELNTDKGP